MGPAAPAQAETPPARETLPEQEASKESAMAGGISLDPGKAVTEIVVDGDRVEYREYDRIVVGTGHVVTTYQDTVLKCDRAVVYLATQDVFLSGHVRVEQPGALLEGEEILYNFETRKGTIIHAEGTTLPWYSGSDRLDKVSDDGMVVREGYLTSCDFEEPHFRLQSRQMRIIPGDRVLVKNATVFVGPVPVAFLVSYTHPLNDRRPRVTLTPGTSKEWGAFLLTSWRYYLHENVQGKVNVDFRERLDVAYGVDTRYKFTEENQGILRTYYTDERRLGREHLLFAEDKAPTVERERYRVQLRHRWEIDRDTTAVLEYHQAKDDRFLQEFFEREFEEDIHPKSYLQILRSSPRFSASFVARKRVNRFESEIEQLPEVVYDVRPTSVDWKRPWRMIVPGLEDEPEEIHYDRFGGSWYYQSSNSFNAFKRKPAHRGIDDHVRRFDTLQQVSYQVKLLRFLSVTPLVNTRQTAYSKLGLSDEPGFRGLMETGFDVTTKFFRIFELETDAYSLDLHRVRHVITPGLGYRYRPDPTIPAEQIMQFDGVDSLAKLNVLAPSLEQKLQTKRNVGGKLQSVDLARWVLSTDYTFKGERDSGGQLANISSDFEARPYSWLLFETDSIFETHQRRLQSTNMDVVAGPGAAYNASDVGTAKGFDRRNNSDWEFPWAVGLGWRWQRDISSQGTAEIVSNIGKKWRIGLYERADFKKVLSDGSKFINRPAETELRIRRDLHEWTVELIFNHDRADGNVVLLLFRLKAYPEQPLEFERSYNRPKLGTRRALFAG
ncbi:MAG: LPS-assembly protein LptD [Candidatus Omnitrophica bacterium]|nr:LPS-assembly protein LptD [Candidatus Omnitrophota bacterium]